MAAGDDEVVAKHVCNTMATSAIIRNSIPTILTLLSLAERYKKMHELVRKAKGERKKHRQFVCPEMAIDSFESDDDGMLCLRDRVQGGVGGWLDDEEDGWRAEVGESYYLDMLRDDARNKAYRDGIERAVERINTDRGVSSVLDIGTGSGLLAMMAKRAGILSHSFSSPPPPFRLPHPLPRSLSLAPTPLFFFLSFWYLSFSFSSLSPLSPSPHSNHQQLGTKTCMLDTRC